MAGQFICSPAVILVHRKVDLQDAEVSEDIWGRFWGLYTRYSQVFKNDSENFGHTDLVTMDRDGGQSAYLTETL